MKRIVLSLLLIAFTSTISSGVFARCLNFSDDENDNHDREVSNIWSCNRSQYLEMWDRFDFEKRNWDDGFGFHHACDTRRPLARTFNALYLLKYSGTSYPTCDTSAGNMLKWAYCWAGNSIDELDGECEKSNGGTTLATTQFASFDDWTELYYPFFYDLTPVERASTIIHEARHAQGWCQHKSCGCRRRASCDPSYYDGCRGFGSSNGVGANAMQVRFLMWFATNSRWSTQWMKTAARNRARDILMTAFCENPCFTLDDQGYPHANCAAPER